MKQKYSIKQNHFVRLKSLLNFVNKDLILFQRLKQYFPFSFSFLLFFFFLSFLFFSLSFFLFFLSVYNVLSKKHPNFFRPSSLRISPHHPPRPQLKSNLPTITIRTHYDLRPHGPGARLAVLGTPDALGGWDPARTTAFFAPARVCAAPPSPATDTLRLIPQAYTLGQTNPVGTLTSSPLSLSFFSHFLHFFFIFLFTYFFLFLFHFFKN